jgi:hypothetical protein
MLPGQIAIDQEATHCKQATFDLHFLPGTPIGLGPSSNIYFCCYASSYVAMFKDFSKNCLI